MIPIAKPYITEDEINAVVDVVRSGWLSLGPKLKEFEENFARYIGTKHAVAISSGTAALHLCVKSLNLKPGDEVITSPFSFIASANCMLYEGAKPVFADIDEKTFNIDISKIERAITPRTKAILPVHVFGHPCRIEEINEIAKKHNLKVVEDTCESLGAEYRGKRVGTFGNPSIFSFYPNKQITTGEGGMIVTDDADKESLFRSLCNQGRSDKSMQWLTHDKLGYNYRMSDMHAALGMEQLKKIDHMLKRRAEIACKYNNLLKNDKRLTLPYTSEDVKHSWFVYVIRLAEGVNRDRIIEKMRENGIATKPYFPAIHLQKFYVDTFGYKLGDFPICEKVSNSALAIPFFIQLTNEEIKKVCETLRRVLDNER